MDFSLLPPLCLVLAFWLCNHFAEEQGAGCFALIVFLLLCGCQWCVPLFIVPRVDMLYLIVIFPGYTIIF